MSATAECPARVVDADGSCYEGTLCDDEQVRLWALCLHSGCHGRVELVAACRRSDGTLRMRSRSEPGHFPAAGDLEALVALAARHRAAGEEVFATPLTRRLPRSGKTGMVLAARVAWVDIDEPERIAELRAFAHRPHLVVNSGSGGAHAYWRLADAIRPDAAEGTNRKLAARLGADQASTDRARIMRLPGSHNYKADRPCRLAFCDLARPGVSVAELVGGLADPDPPAPPPSTAARRRAAAMVEADHAARLDPPTYFRALAGVEVPERGGHVPCPLPDHREQLASCMVYGTADEGWHCFGCLRGGTIYDLTSLLEGGAWGRDLRGEAFTPLKARVQCELGLEGEQTPRPQRRRALQRGAPRADGEEPCAGRL
ncbi:MAG: RepB family DNA primase [Actinomycetota bacterium]|nr:RepB family DNA primase [Actinomycetota bacterium]